MIHIGKWRCNVARKKPTISYVSEVKKPFFSLKGYMMSIFPDEHSEEGKIHLILPWSDKKCFFTKYHWIVSLFYTVTLQMKKHFGRSSFFTSTWRISIKVTKHYGKNTLEVKKHFFALFNNQSNCSFAALYRINVILNDVVISSVLL